MLGDYLIQDVAFIAAIVIVWALGFSAGLKR